MLVMCFLGTHMMCYLVASACSLVTVYIRYTCIILVSAQVYAHACVRASPVPSGCAWVWSAIFCPAFDIVRHMSTRTRVARNLRAWSISVVSLVTYMYSAHISAHIAVISIHSIIILHHALHDVQK